MGGRERERLIYNRVHVLAICSWRPRTVLKLSLLLTDFESTDLYPGFIQMCGFIHDLE